MDSKFIRLCSYSDFRTTPNPILLRSFSEYFSRSFSASSFDLKGFDSGVSSRPMYWKRNQFSSVFGNRNLYHRCPVADSRGRPKGRQLYLER